jgi:hypothetical protein
MPNLVEALCEKLTSIEAETNGIPQLVEHGMAIHLLALVFGYEWYEQRIKFRNENPDEWMLNGNEEWMAANPVADDVRRIVHTHRVTRLADALFTLIKGGTEGIDVLRDRFLTCPTRPCFIETEIASLLVCNGFRITIIKESGARGEDFDLFATRDRRAVSVEVTSKIEGQLTVKTIRNTLRAKRDQVPADRPAVLYMHIPPEWMRDQAACIAILTEAIIDFLRRSKRFNAIVFVWEEIIPFLNGGFPRVTVKACFNEQPRYPFEPRNLFTDPMIVNGRNRMALSFLESLRAKRAKLQTNN